MSGLFTLRMIFVTSTSYERMVIYIDTLTKWSEFYSAKVVSKTQNSGSCYFTVIDSELDDSTADRLSEEEAWLGSSNIEARLGSQPMNR